MIISEYGAAPGVRGIYEIVHTDAAMAEIRTDGKKSLVGAYHSIKTQCERHENNWKRVAERPWLAGGIIWVGMDHRGEGYGWPCAYSQMGIFDACRFPKDTVAFYHKTWCDKPMIHLFPHWTWPGKDKQNISVWAYSNCDEVELSLNGNSLGTQPVRPFEHNTWEVPYNPGTLTAIARKAGKEACRAEVKSAGAPARLEIEADRTDITADGEDLSFITIRILDASGVIVPQANVPVTVTVDGPARLLGLCSGDQRSQENNHGHSMKTFNGLLLAIIQGNENAPGEIIVNAKSDGLTDGRCSCLSVLQEKKDL